MDLNANRGVDPLSSSSVSQHDPIDVYFSQLRGGILFFSAAYSNMQAECKRYEYRLKTLEAQLRGNRIVVIIDENDAILSSSLIMQGKTGGYSAARIISNSVTQYLNANEIYQSQLWAYVFLNTRKILERLSADNLSSSHYDVQPQMNDFCAGFNEASERYFGLNIVNEQASRAKIKALLEHEIQLSSTTKVFLAASYDSSYLITLQSHITAGYKHKIVLIPHHSELAFEIKELGIPFLHIPDLFTVSQIKSECVATVTPQSLRGFNSNPLRLQPVFSSGLYPDTDEARPSSEREDMAPDPTTESLSYSSVPKSPSCSAASDPSSSSQQNGNDVFPKTKQINPNIPLSKHKPPPCTLYYLASCKHGATCKYGHDYILKPEHCEQIRKNAKRSPCPAANKGDHCYYGENCCYGHYCPHATQCIFFKQGRCKFMGVGMHRE
ncbi:hypothetical protein BDQ17DRAFT_85906 [Cyathus striatus]|nr:hypothetical protein BDQ17DRAFT_85906 [Cyathus striatus]